MATNTTDPQDELFDILDADGNPTGEVKPRGLVHRDGDWHRGLHVWVYGFDSEGVPFMLFQRRSMSKDTWPGKLDVAVGGHFGAGEELRDALREAEEEIGLAATVDDLTLLGRRFIEDHGATYIDREINEVFALRSNMLLGEYRQHPDEVDAVVAIPLAELVRLFNDEAGIIMAREVRRNGAQQTIEIRPSDFAGDRNDYRDAALRAVMALAEGMQPTPFLLRAVRHQSL